MSLKVTQNPGFVTIECGGETVIVAGNVLWSTPAPTSAGGPPPTPPLPPIPVGPSAYVSVFAALPNLKMAKAGQPAFNRLIQSELFKEFAKTLDQNCVVSIQPAEKIEAKIPHSVTTDAGKLGLMHKYLKMT